MATPLRAKISAWSSPQATSATVGSMRLAIVISLAVAFVASAARLSVPIPGTVVPASLQDLAVLVVGIALGPRRGAATLLTYVALGATGAPVFSNGHGGLLWLMGPTGGYLLAYPAAAWVAGLATEPARGWLAVLAGILGAQLIVYTGGVLQLSVLTGNGLSSALGLGVTPFLPGAAFKIGMLLAFVGALRWRAATAEPDGGA